MRKIFSIINTRLKINFCRKYPLYLRQDNLYLMLKCIEIQILEKIKEARGGSLYFEDSFASDAAAKSDCPGHSNAVFHSA